VGGVAIRCATHPTYANSRCSRHWWGRSHATASDTWNPVASGEGANNGQSHPYHRQQIVVIVAIPLVVAASTGAHVRPHRGGIPWSFVLRKFSDSPAPPHDVNYYRNMTIVTGQQGLDGYVKAISYGKADLSGSVVYSWYTEPHTLAYKQGLSNRWQRVQDCLDTVATSSIDPYVPPWGNASTVLRVNNCRDAASRCDSGDTGLQWGL